MTNETDKVWHAFRAYNSQTFYGWGTAAEADDYAETRLNARKGINLYSAWALSDADIAELIEDGSLAGPLEENTEAVDLEAELSADA